jgi:hypothetical protein
MSAGAQHVDRWLRSSDASSLRIPSESVKAPIATTGAF